MTDHVLPREPLVKSKDSGKGRACYLDEMTKARLLATIARLRKVLVKS